MFTVKSLGINVLSFPAIVHYLSYEIEFLSNYNILWFQSIKFHYCQLELFICSSRHVTSLNITDGVKALFIEKIKLIGTMRALVILDVYLSFFITTGKYLFTQIADSQIDDLFK